MFRTTFRTRDKEVITTYHRTHYKPVILYASQVWMKYDKVTFDTLESLDRQFWRIAPSTRNNPPPNTLSLVEEALLADLRLAKDMHDNRTTLQFEDFFQRLRHTAHTRSITAGEFAIPPFRINAAKHLFSRRVPRLLNMFGPDKLGLRRDAFIEQAKAFVKNLDKTQLLIRFN
mgnify:FL=1